MTDDPSGEKGQGRRPGPVRDTSRGEDGPEDRTGILEEEAVPLEDVEVPDVEVPDDIGPDTAPDGDGRPPISPTALADCAVRDLSDTDNARRLMMHFPDTLRVRRQEGGRTALWVAWLGTHWDDVSGGYGATRMAQEIGPRIKLEARLLTFTKREEAAIAKAREAGHTEEHMSLAPARDTPDPLKAARLAHAGLARRKAARVKFGVTSKNRARCEAMLAMAAPHLLTDPNDFNADPLKVATPTQTLTFIREPDLECPDPEQTRCLARIDVRGGHSRADLITKLLPFDYDPAAPRGRWTAFVERFLPEAESRRFVQTASGLGVLGLTEQILVFHYGEGANGKSVYLEALSRVLGPLAAGLPAEAVAGHDNHGGVKPSPEIARLYGTRFVRIAEVEENAPLKEAFVKRITGSESFPARDLFEGYFDFRPHFIAHMTGNGYPRITGTDNGIWRRIAVVEWPVTLAKEEQRNFEDVVDELVEEAPGILAWLVEGALTYLAEGLFQPESVRAATQAYRDEMDQVGAFVHACVTITHDPDDLVQGSAMYRAYEAWAVASGLRPISQTKFGKDLVRQPGIVRLNDRIRQYVGVKLHDVPPNPNEDR